MLKHGDLSEEERRAEVARGMEMGNIFCFLDAMLEGIGRYWSAPPVKRVPWWRRHRYRILLLAALAAALVSGSRLL